MRTALIMLILVALVLSGCSYKGTHSNNTSNKFIEEETPLTTPTPHKEETETIPDINQTPEPEQITPVPEEPVEESSWPPEKTTKPYVITYNPTPTTISWPPEEKPSSAGILYEYGVRYRVKVAKVIDGVTFRAIMPDGSEEYIRFLGIDTPETIPSENTQEEYGNITNLECLAEWGEKAKEFTTSMLENRNVSIEFDSLAGMTGYYGRFLAYVYLQDDDFAEILIEQGYARVYTEVDYTKKSGYLEYQKSAIDNSTGLWACKNQLQQKTGKFGGPVIILDVHYDADGDDSVNLNDEYIVLKNIGDSAVNLQGWYMEDVSLNKYYFPDILIQSGSTLTVHSGIGINTPENLYWGSGIEIWDNHHDTVYLYNLSRHLVDYYTW